MAHRSGEEEDLQAVALFGQDVQGVYDRFSNALDEQNVPHRYYGFNSGGSATEKQKNFLRSLLRKHAGTETAEAIRNYLNCRRMTGDPISFGNVSDAIQALRSLTEDRAT
ncbi:hypothetical protein [Nonomuraea sp. NPDC001636]|uniref:hypothetical protein n=1 Tax=Actinomycetes TaxID=1760 RepID=UPI00332F744E